MPTISRSPRVPEVLCTPPCVIHGVDSDVPFGAAMLYEGNTFRASPPFPKAVVNRYQRFYRTVVAGVMPGAVPYRVAEHEAALRAGVAGLIRRSAGL